MARKTAIQKDATPKADTSETKDAKGKTGPDISAPTPELNPRNSAMEQIAGRLEQEMISADPSLAEQLAAQTVGEESLDEGKPAEPDKSTKEPDKIEPAPRMLKVKIDGVEQELPENDVIRGYQKDETASRRLEQAANARKELEARESAVAERERQLTAQAAKESQEPPAPNGDAVKEFLTSFYEGDEEKTEQALRRLVSGGRQEATTPDMSRFVPDVVKQVKQSLDTEKAVEKFSAEYKEIISDPYLAKVADGFFDEEMKTGRSFTESLTEAGNRTRDWIKKYAPAPAPTAKTERASRKESIDNIPAANAVAGSVNTDESESSSSIISQMRKARGLSI